MKKRILASLLSLALFLTLLPVSALAAEDGTCAHNFGSWGAGENETCVRKCKICDMEETHNTVWGDWNAPQTNGNGYINACLRNCTANGCTRNERHSTNGEWVQGEGAYTLTCTVCRAVQTCDHSCGWGPWRIDGENCIRKCRTCSLTESHPSQWGEYLGVDTKQKHYCTGRYCEVDGCNQVNRINTVEELLAAIDAGLTEIQPDAWEPWFYEPHDMQIQNAPITITKDVTIDGGETGVTIQRLGYGYGATKAPTFIVENGATLTLKNLTIRGGGGDMNGTEMIRIHSGKVILDDGAVLTNGGTYGPCSGIYLDGGDLEMREGSQIADIGAASAVCVEEGTFTMNGGAITGSGLDGVSSSGCVALRGSNPASAKFIMNDGVISGNRDSRGFGMGAIMIECGTAAMSGGKITENDGGIVVAEGSLTVTGGEISNNTGFLGAGIMSGSALAGILGGEDEAEVSVTISGGMIKDNKNMLMGATEAATIDVMLGFTNASITGGEIGVFYGNTEMLKFIAALEGRSVEDLTEEELLALATEMGITEEQLATKPTITGGTFSSDVSEYLAAEYKQEDGKVVRIPSSGGSSSGGSSSSTTTETTTNPDGSKTTTVTDKKTGTVTETTKNNDGSTLVKETKKDGTVTTTETRADKVVIKTVDEKGKDVTVAVTTPSTVKSATVAVPAKVTPGTVAVDVKTGEIVKLSVPTEDGMLIKLEGSAKLVLEDRSKDFIDTPGHWGKDAIDFAVAHKMFNGTSETTFTPDGDMTRAMLMTVLARFDGQDTTGGETWYEKGMEWAKANGVSDGTNPNAPITREQLVTMLYRYAGSPAADGSLASFTDAGKVSAYAVDAMGWAVSTGLIAGTGSNTLDPQGSATRAQVATILMRFCTNLAK